MRITPVQLGVIGSLRDIINVLMLSEFHIIRVKILMKFNVKVEILAVVTLSLILRYLH